MRIYYLLLFICVCTNVQGLLIPNTNLCSRYCKASKHAFSYNVGSSYIYQYTGSVNSIVYKSDETHKNETPSFSADIEISVLSPCDFELQVTAVKTKFGNVGHDFETSITQNPIRFSFQTGKIDAVCASINDSVPILNIKKGIISSFQNNMRNMGSDDLTIETDISGICETKYEVLESDSKIRKSKDLTRCNKRSRKYNSWQSEVYNDNQVKFSSPLLKSTQTCIQTYQENILYTAECEEKHLFRPFSDGENGAVTTLQQTLKFLKKISTKTTNTHDFRYTTLIYENDETNSKAAFDMENIEKVLNYLEVNTRNGIEAAVPNHFSLLVSLIEDADKGSLLQLFEIIKDSNRKKKFFVDALSLTKTVNGIEVMKKLYEENEITVDLFNGWVSSLAFTKTPSKAMLQALNGLMDFDYKTKQKVYLTVSSVIYQFCKNNNNCEEDQEILNIFQKILKPILYKCTPNNPKLQDDILITLKSIGNSGESYFQPYLKKCYMSDDVPTELKVASIQAHRRMDCDKNQNLEDLENIFASQLQNPEVRISAYISIMQCSSYTTFEKVKDVLHSEQSNQVGSFIWSHLTNLQETSIFWKRDLKMLLENELLKTKLNTDAIKYSRNYEMSTFFDAIDTGIGMESNVIFTPESYIPKSAMMNFTVDVFGETVNLLEFGARIEGFEDIIENFFGPNGYFPEKSIKTFLENKRNDHEASDDNLPIRNILKRDPYGLLYTKVFGNEISYLKFNDVEILGKPPSAKSLLDLVLSFLKSSDIDYTKSLKFVDTSYKIPTLLGFPLELSVNGTATLGLIIKGEIDTQNWLNYKFNIAGKIYPSTSVEVVGAISVDAYFTKIGLKSISTLNSNMYIDGHIEIDNGKLVDIKINVPKRKMDIINIKSDVFYIKNDESVKLPEISTDGINRTDCTMENFKRITGLRLCHHIKYVNASSIKDSPYFPLTGSFKYSIDVEKVDIFDNYRLKWLYNMKNNTEYNFLFYLDTPNSKINRKLSANFNLDLPRKMLDVRVASPFMSFDLFGNVELNSDKLDINIKQSFNNQSIIDLRTIVKYVDKKYELDFNLVYKSNNILSTEGVVTVTANDVILNFMVKWMKKYFTIFKAKIKVEDDRYILDSDIIDGFTNKIKGTIHSQLLSTTNLLSLTAKCVYKTNKTEESVSLHFNATNVNKIDYNQHQFYFNLISTQEPKYNTLVDLQSHQANLHYDLSGVLNIFETEWKTRQLIKYLKDDALVDVAFISSFSCLKKNIDYKIMLSYNMSSTANIVHGLVQLNKIQRLEALYSNKREGINRDIQVFLYYPKTSYSIKGEITKIDVDKYGLKMMGQKEAHDMTHVFFEVDGFYINSTKDELQNYSLSGKIDLTGVIQVIETPCDFKSLIQISKDIVTSLSEIKINQNVALSKLTWTKDSFHNILEYNQRTIFAINGKCRSNRVELVIGLNIYQHFELGITFQPYTKIEMDFFWDKEANYNHKFFLNLENSGSGLYSMALQYPNQKVLASFTLQSTQIILNVTWGFEIYQKIYLNLGSKVYDLGGIWYGELETPFKYLEKQHFSVKYLILQNSIDVEVQVYWRDHRIEFVASGSRSPRHIKGKVELTTTLQEVYKVAVAVSHTQSVSSLSQEKMTNVSMIFNQHQIIGFNKWTKDDINIHSNFEVSSPTNTIKPIFLNLDIASDKTASYMNSILSWQENEISISFKVENSMSLIVIKTPFTGIEKTKLQYALIRTNNDMSIVIEIDILNQLNHILLQWSNGHNNTYNVQFEIISPMTGTYQLLFKHSTKHGYLMENLIVNHGKDNRTILGIELNGSVVSIWDVDLVQSVKFLDHNVVVKIKNTAKPYSSKIELLWDQLIITSNVEVLFTHDKLNKIYCLVSSSTLPEPFEFQYTYYNDYSLIIKIPNGYVIQNSFELQYPYNIQGVFLFKAPQAFGKLSLKHSFRNGTLSEHMKIAVNEQILIFNGEIKCKESTSIFDIIDLVNINVDTSWNDTFELEYTKVFHQSIGDVHFEPLLIMRYNNKTLETKANLHITPVILSGDMLIHGSHITSIGVKGQYNFQDKNFELHVDSVNIDGHISFKSNEGILLVNIKTKVNLTLQGIMSLAIPNIQASSESRLLLKIQMDTSRPLELYFKSEIPGWENVNVRLVKYEDNIPDIHTHGVLTINKNDQSVICRYNLKDTRNAIVNFDINITSSIDYLNNSYVRMYFNIINREIAVKTKISKYESELVHFYNSDEIVTSDLQTYTKDLKILILFKYNATEVTNIHLDAKANLTQNDDNLSLILSANSNKSNLNVTLSKQGSAEILMNISSVFHNTFANSYFNYKNKMHLFEVDTAIECNYANITSNIVIKKSDILEGVSFVELSKDGALYRANISTEYQNFASSDWKIELKSPKEFYNGDLRIHLGDVTKSFIVLMNSSQSYNKLDCILNVHNIKKINGILDFQIDLLETASAKITLDYDLEAEHKKLMLYYHPDLQSAELIKLDVKLNRNDVSITIQRPENKKYFILNGKYRIQDKEVNIQYDLQYLKHAIRADFFYINKKYTQTKLEINTNIKKWENFILENRIDDFKVRIFMYSRYHQVSLIADKTALLDQEKDLFIITYNEEPLVNIRSGKDQMFLMTSSLYINYKLGIQYVSDPRIYAFSILRNGENLMSFVLQNKSNFKYMQLRGKLIAPILFTNYPDITFNFDADYRISKLLQFTLTTANKKLFEIKWFSKLKNSLYEAYFKYSSELPLLKLNHFEIHPSVNMWDDFTFKLNFANENNLGYFTELVIPFKDLNTKFVLEFPCKTHQCSYYFYCNETYFDVNWNLPIENLNKVSLKGDFTKSNTLNNSLGTVVLEKNEDSIVYGWDIDFSNTTMIDRFFIYVKSNVNKTIHNREIRYDYQTNKHILLNVGLDNLTTIFRYDNNIVKSTQFTMEKNGEKIVYSGFLSDKYLNLTISNDVATKHIVIRNESKKTTRIDLKMSTDSNLIKVSSQANKEEEFVAVLIKSITFIIIRSLYPDEIKSKVLFDTQNEVKFDFNTTTLFNTEENDYNLTFRYNNPNSTLLILGPYIKYNLYYNQAEGLQEFGVEDNNEKRVYLKNLIKKNEITDIQVFADAENIAIDFALQYFENLKTLLVKIPSFFKKYALYDLKVSNTNNEYVLENKIALSNNETISVTYKATFLPSSVNMEIFATSPYTDVFNSTLLYAVKKTDINVFLYSLLGDKNITAVCNIVPKKEISVIIKTPFAGYTSLSLDTNFNKATRKAYFKLLKENHSLILDGEITNISDYIYELNMSAKTEHSNEPFAFVCIKLDQRIMKFNANLNWHSKVVLLGFGYDPKKMLLEVETPLEQLKTLKLTGGYVKSNNTYKLEGNGQWDSTNIVFYGTIGLEPNDFNLKSEIIVGENHQGKIDLSVKKNNISKHFKLFGYFPKPSSNTYLTIQSNITHDELSMKTPFEHFKDVSIILKRTETTMEVKTEVNIAKTTISAEVQAVKNGSAIDINTLIRLPSSQYSTEMSLDVMSSHFKTDDFYVFYDFRDTFVIKLYSSIPENIVFEIVHQNSKGEIFLKYTNSNTIISYAILDYFNFRSKYSLVDVNLELSKNNFKLTIGNPKQPYYDITYINNLEKFQINFIDNESRYNFELNKDLSILVLEIQELLKFFYEKNNTKLEMLLKTKDLITAQFNTTKSLINFCVNSTIMDAISISGKLETGKLFGETVFKFLKQNENLIYFNEFHDNKQVNITFDFKNTLQLVLKHQYKNSKMSIHLQNNEHEITYESTDLATIRLLFKSPTIPNNGFIMQGNAVSLLNLRFAINSVANNIVYLKLTTNYDRTSYSLDFHTPQNDILSYIHFKTIWGNSIFKSLNKIEVTSSKLGNVSAIGDFDLTEDGLDIVTHFRLPFLKTFELFDAEVHIHRNDLPWFLVRLPNNKEYSANIIYFNDDDLFRLDLTYVWAESKYGLNMTYLKDNSYVLGEFISPLQGYQHFVILLKKEGNDLYGFLNLNERLYNANISHSLEDQHQWFHANLSTPFIGYENYYFEIDHGNHFFKCFLYYPNLKRPIGFGFDNRYKHGIYYKLSLLYPFLDLKDTFFEVNITPDDSMLIINAASELNNNFVNINVQVNKLPTLKTLDIAVKTNHHKVEFIYNTYENYLRYNKKYIYNVNFEPFNLYASLFAREINCELDYGHKHATNLKFNISNTRIPNEQYGWHFVLNTLSNISSIGLYLPYKIIIYDQKYLSNLTDSFYMSRLSWNNKPIGFTSHLSKTKKHDLININFKLDIELPIREFQLDHNFKLHMKNLEPITTEIASKFRWDKHDNATIAWQALLSSRNMKSIISSAILEHDVILNIEFSKLSEIPFRLMLEMEYSALLEKRVHIEMFYNKTFINDVMVDERKFIVSQPFSRLNHTTIWKTSRCDKYTNITVLLHYTDFVLKTPDFIKASLEIGHQEFELSGLVENKKNSLSIHSKSNTNLYSKGLNIQLKINDNEPLTLDYLYTFKEPTPSFKLITGYGKYRNYYFYIGFPTKKELTTKLVYNIYGKEFTDALVTLKLNTTSLLWVKMIWKTNMLSQFHKAIIDEYTDIKFVAQSIGRQLIDVMSDHIGKELLKEFQNVRKSISNYTVEETKKISTDMGLLWTDIKMACSENTLYCKDIIHLKTQYSNIMYKSLTEPFINIISKFYINLTTIAEKTYENIVFLLDEIEKTICEIEDIQRLKENAKLALNNALHEAKKSIKTMKETAKALVGNFERYIFGVKNDIDELLKPALNVINEFWTYFEHQLTYVQIVVLETMDVIQTYTLNLRETKQLLRIYNGITLSITSIDLMNLIHSISNVIESIASNIITNLKDVCDDYTPFVNSLKLTIFGTSNQPLSQQFFEDFKDLLDAAYEKLVWVWKHHQMTENIKSYVMMRWSSFINIMVTNLIGNTEEGLGIFDYIYKPEYGVIEISQRLPVEWESFDKSPAFEQHPLYNHIFQKISLVTVNRFEMLITKLKVFVYTLLNIKIAPPTNNFAMIIGNEHFVTFNNKHFTFKGDCSYVLLSDIDKKSFSIILNYDQNLKRQSLTVNTYKNSATVELFKDSKVMVNSEIVDLPILIQNLYITKDADDIIIENNEGLIIICNFYYNYCTFEVSEWLFGKVTGLLGTLDNEPNTDMTTPYGLHVETVEDLANSWKVAKCVVNNTDIRTEKRYIPAMIHKLINSTCTNIFVESNSTMAPCFSIVNSKPFYDMCIMDIKTNREANLCSSIAAYKSQCNDKHIKVNMPTFCVSCSLDTTIESEEKIFDVSNPKSLDIVFIQEFGCLNNISRNLPIKLNNALVTTEFARNRFASVVYGGSYGVKPTVNTINGSIWTDEPFEIITSMISHQRGGSRYTVEEAIKFAAKLQFRPAISKLFVLIQCSVCGDLPHSPDLFNILGENDINLHIIKPNPFGEQPILAMDSTNQLIDTHGVFKKVVSNQIYMDKLQDMCCGLALSTSGTAAKSSIFDHNGDRWFGLVVNTVKQSSCQKCKCIQNKNGVGKVECMRCMSPLVKQLLSEYDSQHIRT